MVGVGETMRWSEAMRRALYGSDGFYASQEPGRHFRTSAQSPLFATALAELVRRVDVALGGPDEFAVVDVGAGGGELLAGLLAADDLEGRLRPAAVELRPRPESLDPRIDWRDEPPAGVVGMIVACEWLDNVPCDVVEVDEAGRARYELVDPASERTVPGELVDGADADWLRRWWPATTPGTRAEIGRSRDEAWASLTNKLEQGIALAVDYGHIRQSRPPLGTLAGFARGRQVTPVPDGSCDVTAHVAVDSLDGGSLCTQREALRRLGIDGARPPLELARRDPAGYVRALSHAGEAVELTDPAGLGGHWWVVSTRGDFPDRIL
ncbi:MAG: SAM-dependent methyltransferase [Stackebrandtia sp.]